MDIIQMLFTGLMVGSVYGLIAMGFCLIFKASGVFNLAQGELVMISAFLLWAALKQIGLPTALALVIVLVAAALLGFLIQHLCIRPLIGQPLFASVMMTIAVALILRGIVTAIWVESSLGYPSVFPDAPVMLGQLNFSQPIIWGFGTSLLVVTVFSVFFRRARIGLSMRTVSDDQQIALGLGINVGKIMSIVWIMGALLGAAGGIVLGNIQGVSDVLASIGLKALPVALLAGLESVQGALLGGIIVGIGEVLAAMYLDPLTKGGMTDLFPFLLMLLILLFKPEGLFGLKRIERI